MRYLDWQVSKINRLIAAKKKQIELLKECKNTVLSQVIRIGLDLNGETKDSGIGWLGIISSSSTLTRIGKLTKSIQTGPFGSQLHSSDYILGGTPVINPTNIQNGQIVHFDSCTISSSMCDMLSVHKLHEGDIVMGRRGEMGRCALVEPRNEGWICGTGSLQLEMDKERCCPAYVAQYLSTAFVKDYLMQISIGSTMCNLNCSIVANIPIALPSKSKQAEIVEYIKNETKTYETAVQALLHQIDTLHELRTRLISDVVTGQIDVRDIEVPDFEYVEEAVDTDDADEAETDDTGDQEV